MPYPINPVMAALQQNQQGFHQTTPQIPQTNVAANPMQNAVAQVKQMMDAYHAAQNPQAFIQQSLQSNPAYQNAVNRIKQFQDPKAAFYARAKELGIDPDEFVKQIQGGM